VAGGGNFLIELGETSDNTFRILDYGREFEEQPRDMHYLQAMYALNEVGFFDDGSEERLILKPDSGGDSCHRLLKCGLYDRQESIRIDESEEWSFVMNPDGSMTLSEPRSRLLVGRCRTSLIQPGKAFTVCPKDADNRVFHFARRVPNRPSFASVWVGHGGKLEYGRTTRILR